MKGFALLLFWCLVLWGGSALLDSVERQGGPSCDCSQETDPTYGFYE